MELGRDACRRNFGCADVHKANEFLRHEYIAEFNRKFMEKAAQKGTAFVRLHRRDLDWIFSVQHERMVNRDNTVVIGNRVWPGFEDAKQIHRMHHTTPTSYLFRCNRTVRNSRYPSSC